MIQSLELYSLWKYWEEEADIKKVGKLETEEVAETEEAVAIEDIWFPFQLFYGRKNFMKKS